MSYNDISFTDGFNGKTLSRFDDNHFAYQSHQFYLSILYLNPPYLVIQKVLLRQNPKQLKVDLLKTENSEFGCILFISGMKGFDFVEKSHLHL
jgi:hypothetical protein